MYDRHIQEKLKSYVIKHHYELKHGNYRVKTYETYKYVRIKEVNGFNNTINKEKVTQELENYSREKRTECKI